MKREVILTALIEGLESLVAKYDWLTIKYEYSEVRGVYLVSYSSVNNTNFSEDFLIDSINFEDRMCDTFGDDAPLFCDEEELFKLSIAAEIIGCKNGFMQETFSSPIFENTEWVFLDVVESSDTLKRRVYAEAA